MPDLFAVPAALSVFLSSFASFTGLGTARYLIFVGLSFAAWRRWHRTPWRRQKIQMASNTAPQIKREILYSTISIIVFAAIPPAIVLLGVEFDRLFYKDIATYGWGYFFLSIAIMMLVQDTYFYWTHRLMHHRKLFRYFHRTHHLSTNPNPWTTYAMSPQEAVVDAGASVLILFLVPKTFVAYLIFLWLNTAYAVYGHLGYEILPRGAARHWLGRWINTSVAHNTHHERPKCNYGWYFLFWDRMMDTIDPDYERRYGQVRAPRADEPSLDNGAITR